MQFQLPRTAEITFAILNDGGPFIRLVEEGILLPDLVEEYIVHAEHPDAAIIRRSANIFRDLAKKLDALADQQGPQKEVVHRPLAVVEGVVHDDAQYGVVAGGHLFKAATDLPGGEYRAIIVAKEEQ